MTTTTVQAANARLLEKIYQDVPVTEVEAFQRFRRESSTRKAEVCGTTWNYLAGGTGERSILFLPGAQSTGESAWANITHFSSRFRWLSPSYPALPTMAGLADGLVKILDHEGIERTTVIGGSYGGFVAQVLVRRHPDRVERLILSHTGPPNPRRGHLIAGSLRWLPLLPMFLLRLQYRKVMMGLVPQRPELAMVRAYLEEVVRLHLTKEGLLAGYRRVVDYDAQRFTPADLEGWMGRVLLIMADNDPGTPEPVRSYLKTLYPRADVRLFEGSGHATGVLKREEYLVAMDDFLGQ